MKQILFAAIAGFIFMLTSCDSKTAMNSDSKYTEQEQKNLAAFETVGKAFETGDPAGIDSVVADDFLDHTDHGDVKGKDSLKAMITHMHTSFPDMKSETLHQVADGDYVYGWMQYSGTSDGSMGMPKGPYKMSAIELVKFNNGQATEHWSFMETQDMMKMMGPQPGMNSMDTSMKK